VRKTFTVDTMSCENIPTPGILSECAQHNRWVGGSIKPGANITLIGSFVFVSSEPYGIATKLKPGKLVLVRVSKNRYLNGTTETVFFSGVETVSPLKMADATQLRQASKQ